MFSLNESYAVKGTRLITSHGPGFLLPAVTSQDSFGEVKLCETKMLTLGLLVAAMGGWA